MLGDKQNEVGIIFLLSGFAFIGVFFRQYLFGYDGYAFVSFARGFVGSFGWHPGFDYIVGYLPQSFLIYELLMFFCFFISLLALYYIGKSLFSADRSFVALLVLLAGSPIMLFEFAKFENELIAFPLLFWSFYFVYARKGWKNQVVGLLLSLFAVLFWWGAFVWIGIIAFGLALPFTILFIVSLPFLWDKLGWAFGTIQGVLFNMPFYGLINFFLLFFAIPFVFLEKNKKILVPALICLMCLCFSARFVILFVPFLLIGIVYLVDVLLKRGIALKTIVITCFFFIICWNVAINLQHPTGSEMALVDYHVELCDLNKKCLNDWDFGWWIESQGLDTNWRGGFPNPDYNLESKPFFALTMQDLNCVLLKQEGLMKEYNCN